MSSLDSQGAGVSQPLVDLEKAVFRSTGAAFEAMKRIECLDEEQRAEAHAILEAIRHESGAFAGGASTWGVYVPVRKPATDERAGLRQHFSEVLSAVLAAADEFDRQAAITQEPPRREALHRLAREQRRRVELAERLLEIIDQ